MSTRQIIPDKILKIFSDNSDKPFVIDAFTGKNYTYKEILNLSLRFGTYLRGKGIGAGDKIVYVVHNSIETVLFYFASMFIGAVAVPVNPSSHHREIKFIIDSVNPKLIVSTAEIIPYPKDFFPQERIVYIEQSGKVTQGEISLDILKNLNQIKPFEGVKDEDPYLMIVYTSGTTSRPKGVVHRFSHLINNASAFCSGMDITHKNRFLCILPMTYLAGCYNLLFLPFVAGASVVIWEDFGPKTLLTFWEIVEKHDVNTLWFVPTILAIMLKMDRSDKGPKFCRGKIKRALVGTAPLPFKIKQDFENKYGVRLYENYGLSEALFITTELPRYPFVEKSVGRIIEGVEVIIKDYEGNVLPVNKEGEIWVKSPYLMDGYYLSEKDGPDIITKNEWYPTGDIGYLTPKGEVFIAGRKNDLIIKGGINISPKAVEDVLHECPNVEEAVVVGVPHEFYGETIAAILKIKEGLDFDEEVEQIKEYCNENLSFTKCPSLYLKIEDFPKSLSRKIQRYKIKDLIVAKMNMSHQANTEKVKEETFIIDLSLPIEEGMMKFPRYWHPFVNITTMARHSIEGRETKKVVMGTHTGTHIDAPLHFINKGKSIDKIDLFTLIGKCFLVTLNNCPPGYKVTVNDFIQHFKYKNYKRILFRFDWSRFWGKEQYYKNWPFLDYKLCKWLIDSGIELIGFDTPSPDASHSDSSQNHKIFLENNIIMLEYLTNLDKIESDEFFLVALPLKIKGADGSPSRIIAINKTFFDLA